MPARNSRRSKYRNAGHEPQIKKNTQSEPIIPQYTTNTSLVLTKDRLERVAAWEVYFNKKHVNTSIWPGDIQNQVPQNYSQFQPTEQIQQTPLCLWHYGEPPSDEKYREYKLFD